MIEQLPATHRLITIDLVGHGQTDAPKLLRYYSMQEQVEILEAFFEWKQIEQFDLIGYSMGGRVALAYAMNYPQRIHTLILENASPGLKTIEEREQRIQLIIYWQIELNSEVSWISLIIGKISRYSKHKSYYLKKSNMRFDRNA